MYLCTVVFQMPMRNRAEMRHKALLSRHILTKENNVKITDFFGGSNIFATLSLLSLSLSLSQVLTYNSLYIIKLRGHPRQYTAFFASVQGKPQCFLS